MTGPFPLPGRATVADTDAKAQDRDDAADSQTDALRVIAGLLLVGASWLLAAILVPFVLAVTLAVAFSPVATWMERRGAPRSLSALACTLAVLVLISSAVGLIVFEAGTIAQDSDKYVHKFGALLDRASRQTHSDRAFRSLGLTGRHDGRTGVGREQGPAGETRGPDGGASPAEWEGVLRRSLNGLGGWLVSGVGGLLGVAGGGVVFLAFLFYLLEGRDEWVRRLVATARRLGLRPGPQHLEKVRHEVVTYLGCLSMVATGYVVVVSLALWLIGVPQPLLWGLLAGMLETVPYFGPLIASVFPTVVALSLGTWWQPAATAGVFLALHVTEGYFISPQLYGRAVKLEPVTILLGALFFGWIWGPIGLAVATPMMIVLRGLLLITPDTPALDALADIKAEKATASLAPVRNGP